MTFSSGKENICLLRAICTSCLDDDHCLAVAQDYDYFPDIDVQMFGTKIMYECETAFEFQDPENDTATVPDLTLEADWNGTWVPYSELTPCIREKRLIVLENPLHCNHSHIF